MRPVASTMTFWSSVMATWSPSVGSLKVPMRSTWSFGRTQPPTDAEPFTSTVKARAFFITFVDRRSAARVVSN